MFLRNFKFNELIKDMIKLNIIFYEQNELIKFLNTNFDNINLWWNSNTLQNLRIKIIKKLFKYDKKWIIEWEKALT